MQKKWNLQAIDSVKTDILFESLKINRHLCAILANRNIDNFEKAKDYFRPQLGHLHSPWKMKDMKKAVERLLIAINNNEFIMVYGDYDVDGTTSVASMYQFLAAIHNKVGYYIPHRYKEGYGVSKLGIEYAKKQGYTLIVSLDCGIKSVELIAYAKEIGIDFIVCDHHLPDTIVPDAVAILNPKQTDCNYPYKELCGCGVGFKLMTALAEQLHLPSESYLQYLDLVATAIAADIVPITGENRVLAFYGIKKINESPCAGIKALLELSGASKQLQVSSLVFVIAPRINAAGRMDDARKAVQLFIEKDYEQALKIAALLHSDNTDRKETDANITEEAVAMLAADQLCKDKKATVVYQPHWHKGVVGIVASRLIENHYKPTIVLTRSGDIVSGSARSVVGFNLYEAVHACRQYLIGYGGHFAAAGMTLLPENVEAFANAFEKEVAATITEDSLMPEIIIDAEIKLKDITKPFYNIIHQMEPFGPDNMRPVFITRKVSNTGFCKVLKEVHVRFVVQQENVIVNGIGFNLAHKFHLLEMNEPVDIVYTIDLNEWNNETQIQIRVIDLKLSFD